MKYGFNFKGGIVKYSTERITSKFLLFHLILNPDKTIQEKIFFTSLRDGHIVDSSRYNNPTQLQDSEHLFQYETNDPMFKIFTLMEGFGVQKQFYSMFFSLDIHGRETTILPLFDKGNGLSFTGKGRFLNTEEVKILLGEDSISYNFYRKQAPLPKSTLKRLVNFKKREMLDVSSSKVRRIRF